MILELDEVEHCIGYCREFLAEPLDDMRGAAAKKALAELAKAAFPYCELLKIDPTSRTEVAQYKDKSQAARFVAACYCAGDAFEAYEMYDDQDALLDDVWGSAVVLLAEIGTQTMNEDKAREVIERKGEEAREFAAKAATARIEVNRHRAPITTANDKRKTKAQRQAERAAEVAETRDLLTAAQSGPNPELAAVYDMDPDVFLREARHNNSSLRKKLERHERYL